MQYLGSNLAREVNRLTGWSGPVFQSRYSMIVVTEEETAQVERLQYLLAQGCKENLVERLREWPGVHSATALLGGESLTGHWIDRTRASALVRRRKAPEPQRFLMQETVVLAPLPCWSHLTATSYRRRIAVMVDAIEKDAAAERRRKATSPMGARAILAQHPHHRPSAIANSPAPLVHAASRRFRRSFREAYGWFVSCFRAASAQIRRGDLLARFPAGSFPPGLPFVPT